MNINSPAIVPRQQVLLLLFLTAVWPSVGFAQSVCLPAPRLLTTVPMGGQVGTTVEVTISGENLEELDELSFSHPGITAVPKLAADGTPRPQSICRDDCRRLSAGDSRGTRHDASGDLFLPRV